MGVYSVREDNDEGKPEMAITAVLRKWTEESRTAGGAWIDVVNADGDNRLTTVTVAKGQSAKAALAAAGWEIVSGVRRNTNGDPVCLVQRVRRVPSLSRLITETGLV